MKTSKTLTSIALTLLLLTFIGSLVFTITLPQNDSMKQAVTTFLENDPKYQRQLDTGEAPSISLSDMAAETLGVLQFFFVIPTVYIAIICFIVLVGFLLISKKPAAARFTLFSAAILSLLTIIVPILLFIAGGKLRTRPA
ncbi:DUF4064 domain-containing protein [Terribacillus sp. DMT04]|uniref:DUF4064 domain-containing protein n=1 Tax=Terribacillus sp. DMT04 TaxID=2850441 RepID=UPI001C2BC7B7|nr:DUF4064 domain-containing protein [Terribacillus sp. DMT04]QXE01429.1 DUF4064 domain-containing protein [Terribacillus sp. DMT04]